MDPHPVMDTSTIALDLPVMAAMLLPLIKKDVE